MTERPILLATDGSLSCEAATVEAIRLAALQQVSLIALCVAPEGTDVHVHRGAPGDRTQVEHALAARNHAVLASVQARTAAAGVDCETIEAHGDPAEEICAAARVRRARLVVVGTHGRRRVGRLLHGSVSELVVGRCACPVLVVRAPAPE